MFWGLTLESGKHYSQSVEDSFHVSMAALELEGDYKDTPRPPVKVMVQHDKKDFLLCSLLYGSLIQQQLDLDFTEGEQVTFFLEGSGVVHLTGSLVQEKPFEVGDEPILGSPPESDEDGMEVSEDESDGKDEDDAEEVPSLTQLARGEDVGSDEEDDKDWIPEEGVSETHKKRKLEHSAESQESKAKKKATGPKGVAKKAEDSDDEYADEDDEYADEDNEENMGDEMADLFEDIEAHGQTNGKRESRPKSDAKTKKEKPIEKEKQKQIDKEEEKVTSSEDAAASPSKKKKKKKKKQPGSINDDSKPTEGAKQNVQKEKQDDMPQVKRRKLPNGVIIQDLVVGSGKIAKTHKMVGVYYRGVLAKSKQHFDSCLSGRPFRFRLGSHEVISGWDTGLVGMRVGGKRKLVIPPSQGYGNSRAGQIPPNSTLIFEVELKEVR